VSEKLNSSRLMFLYFLNVDHDSGLIRMCDVNYKASIESNQLLTVHSHGPYDFMIDHNSDDFLYYIKG
jgi:hypothetical protein